VCVCNLSYPACKAHAPFLYCHLWPVRICNIFPHYLINGTIFGGKITEYEMCFGLFLISSFSLDLNVVCFLLGDTPAASVV
jgi:hypothetical protein